MTRKPSSVVGFVPAKGHSERAPGKNVWPLAGHPLIAYSIAAAREAGIFSDVVVSTESAEIAEIARRYGAAVVDRPIDLATPTSSDIDWVLHAMRGRSEDAFAILRPTSPFRGAATIRRGWERLLELGDRADSIRAVEVCPQHPAKMWRIEGELIRPVLERPDPGTPWHSMQFQVLPEVWVQNSSLEFAWRHVLEGDRPTISGERVAPFFTEDAEGFSIDYPEDFDRAERLLAEGAAELPAVLEAVH
jgi:CMP-N,N'-diacetyllegionaminic acid synthase